MSAEDLEKYETEMELQLYREYRDIVRQFTYVVETERRFYLAHSVDLQVREAGGEVYFELKLSDAWVWDRYRPARFGRNVRGRTFKCSDAGLRVLDRNWRCREGELDIVARDGDALVFCEVKTRRGTGFGHPVEAVTPTKQRRLRTLAQRWLAAHDEHAPDLRFDVVGILVRPAR